MPSIFKTIFLSVLSICLLNQSVIHAQQKATYSKTEQIREILKEKMLHPSFVDTDERDLSSLLKTTGAADQRISFAAGYQESEVSIAVNPADSSKLVLSYMQQGSGLTFPMYYSSNGGTTWKKSSFNPATILNVDFPGQVIYGGGDPAFAWNKQADTAYFSWIYLSGSASGGDTAYFTLNWAYSYDDGKTWIVKPGTQHFIGQGIIDISTGAEYPYKDGICDREWLAIDNSGGPHQGRLYCSFVNFNQGGECIKFKEPGASSFGSIHLTSGSGAVATQFGNVEVDKKGMLHVTYAELGNNIVYHVATKDGSGTRFTTPVPIYTGVNLFGKTGIVHSRENAAPNLSIDDAGNLHVVWSDFIGTDVFSFYSRSTDSGATWSAPLRLDSVSTLFYGKLAFMPTVAAAGNNISISLTVIDAVTADDSARYYQLVSTDAGKTFSSPALLSSAATYYPQYVPSSTSYFFGDYNRSVRTVCNTFALWEDGRGGIGPKVYFAKTNHCKITGIQEVTAVTASLQVENIYPNPATGKASLQIEGTKDETITIEVHDITGKKLLQQQHNIHSGTQTISIPLSNMNTGIYEVSVFSSNTLIATRSLQVLHN